VKGKDHRDMRKKRRQIQEGHVAGTLLTLTLQMFVGLLSIFLFNLVDLYFIGRLGTRELAALSFTFPVIIFLANLGLGIGMGVSIEVSRAYGKNDKGRVYSATSAAVLTAVVMSAVLGAAGLISIRPLFSMLGADRGMISLIREYVTVWYLGLVFFMVPLINNNIMRALGDVKTASILLFSAVCLNLILDPLLIFGLGPFPRLGLRGAALATVISRSGVFFVGLGLLYFREKVIKINLKVFAGIKGALKNILYLGLSNSAARILFPIAAGVVTRLMAEHGETAVAAYGIASRVEALSLTMVFSMAGVISPFVGQNCGAGQIERVRKGIDFSTAFSLVWGALLFLFFFSAARPVAKLFDAGPAVVNTVELYLRTVSIGYGFHGVVVISAASLIVLHRPVLSFASVFVEMFVLYIPLALAGNYFFGTAGIFSGLCIAYMLSGVLARTITEKVLAERGILAGGPEMCETGQRKED
jgi:putative MATE family efflux protein